MELVSKAVFSLAVLDQGLTCMQGRHSNAESNPSNTLHYPLHWEEIFTLVLLISQFKKWNSPVRWAQGVKHLLCKPGDQSSSPRTHRKVERESQLYKALTSICTHAQIVNKKGAFFLLWHYTVKMGLPCTKDL